MDYNESQRNVMPEPGDEQKSQDAERLPITAEPVKNILVALGLVSPLPVSIERSQKEIEETLHASELGLRVAAARALGEQSGPLSLPIIFSALHHEDEAVRAATVGSIGRLKAKVSLDLLLDALRDSAWYVRACAVHELGCQIERAPILPLIEALHDEDESVRAEAVWALSRFQEHAPDVLLDALHDPSWLVREAAEEFMKERLEQAFHASGKVAAGDFFDIRIGSEALLFSEEPDAEVPPSRVKALPTTGPLPQYALKSNQERSCVASFAHLIEWHGIEIADSMYERRRRVRQIDEPRPLQKASRKPQKLVKATGGWGSWLGKALVALLILGLGLSWSTLVQRFHQSSVASQGSLSCVFHPGNNASGNVMAWPSEAMTSSLFASAGAGGTVETYDANTCRHVAEYKQEPGSSVLALKWANDSLHLAILTASGDIEVLSEQDSGQPQLLLAIAANRQARRTLVAWSENGQYLAVNQGDSRVQIWSVQDRQLAASYTSPYGAISALAWSPNNTEIAAASVFDNQSKAASIQIWSLLTRSTIGTDISMSTTVAAMAWSKDAENLLIYDQNGVVNKWSRQTQNYNSLNPGVYNSLQQLPDFTMALAYAPDGRRYAISTAGDIQIWDAITAQQLGTVSGGLSGIDQLSWSNDGEHIAASSREGTVQVWKMAG